MKKIMALFTALILNMFACLTYSHAETLITYGGQFPDTKTGYVEFLKDNPGISMKWSDVIYNPPALLTSALISGQFDCDLFVEGTDAINWKDLMKKGYCLDLSGSSVLTKAVNRMHPQIAAEAYYNGRLYAVPMRINFIYWKVAEETWDALGYALSDVPNTFSDFLVFLSSWCDRLEQDPDLDVGIIGGWDGSKYNSGSYTQWLTELLIDEYIMQMQYAGEELSFASDELAVYLDQITELGKRIYRLEPKGCTSCLFEYMAYGAWPEQYDAIVFFRLNEQQPRLIRSTLYMWAINPSSSDPDKCVELLEKVVSGEDLSDSAAELFLYRDAVLKENPEYKKQKEYWTQQKEDVENVLQSNALSPESRLDFEEKLNRYDAALALVESQRWLLTEEQLRDYQNAAEMLYFPAPSVFELSSEGYDTLDEKISRFGSGKLSAEQLLESLKTISNMLRDEIAE